MGAPHPRLHPAPPPRRAAAARTGSFAAEILRCGPYRYYGLDRSPEMVAVARRKAETEAPEAVFAVGDFTQFTAPEPADAIILLYDGLNYVLHEDGLRGLFRCAFAALAPGGLFLFDQSTPANSINNEAYFEDAGDVGGIGYVRRSRFDPGTRLHTTTFDLSWQGRAFREEHVQRAYTLAEVRARIAETPFVEVKAYRDFSTRPATEAAERVHWILRKPA